MKRLMGQLCWLTMLGAGLSAFLMRGYGVLRAVRGGGVHLHHSTGVLTEDGAPLLHTAIDAGESIPIHVSTDATVHLRIL